MLNRPLFSLCTSLSLHALILLIALYGASQPIADFPSFATVEIAAIAQLPQGLQQKSSAAAGKPKILPEPKPIVKEVERKRVPNESPKPSIQKTEVKSDKTVSKAPKYDYQIPVSGKNKPQPTQNKLAETKKTVKKQLLAPKVPRVKDVADNKLVVVPKHASIPSSEVKELLNVLDDVLGDYNESAPASSPFGNIDELSGDERSIIKYKIENAWFASVPIESENFRVELLIKLDERGKVLKVKTLNTKCPNNLNCQALVAAAERAVYDASPFDNLPLERYYIWREIQLNFDPSNTL